jgi:hypothetical protein
MRRAGLEEDGTSASNVAAIGITAIAFHWTPKPGDPCCVQGGRAGDVAPGQLEGAALQGTQLAA